MMYEGEDTNTIDLLYEKDTESRDGVKVIIPIKSSDSYSFEKKIKEQLCYFQNVYFNVDGISNNFSIYRGKTYQMSEMCTARHMHICLDDVYYPIDWEKLGISAIELNIGIRFTLTDSVFPTPNREAIRYTTEAKAAILAKLQSVADEFIDIYNESLKDDCTFHNVIDYYSTQAINIPNPMKNDEWIDVKALSTITTRKVKLPTMSNIKLLDLKKVYYNRSYILQEYEYKGEFNHRSWKSSFNNCNTDWSKQVEIGYTGMRNRTIYLLDGALADRKKRYVKETFNKSCYFIKKVKSIPLFKRETDINGKKVLSSNKDSYYGLLELHNLPRESWRDAIKEFQIIRDEFVSMFLPDFEIPEAWIIADKASRKVIKSFQGINIKETKKKGDVAGKVAENMKVWSSSQNCKFVNKVWKGDTLHKTKKLMIYGKAEDKVRLDMWWTLLSDENAEIIILADREIKVLESYNLSNWMSLNKFEEGKNQLYRRTIATQLIYDLEKSYHRTFQNLHNKSTNIDIIKGFMDDVRKLDEYKHRNKSRKCITYSGNFSLDIDEIVKKGNVDQNIYDVICRTTKILKTYSWVSLIYSEVDFGNVRKFKDAMQQLARYNKIHMEKDSYNLTEGYVHTDENGQMLLFAAS